MTYVQTSHCNAYEQWALLGFRDVTTSKKKTKKLS